MLFEVAQKVCPCVVHEVVIGLVYGLLAFVFVYAVRENNVVGVFHVCSFSQTLWLVTYLYRVRIS